MATTLTISQASAKVIWTYEDVRAWANSTNSSNFGYSKSLANGTGASQADKIYLATGTISASATLSLDLAGSLTDIFGNTITLARVKILYFELQTTTSASSVLIGASTNPWVNWVSASGDKVRVRNGGCLFLCAPDATAYAVTAGTGDALDFVNEDGSNVATYRLAIVGSTA